MPRLSVHVLTPLLFAGTLHAQGSLQAMPHRYVVAGHGEHLGTSVDFTSDLDGDGLPEILVGASGTWTTPGSVSVLNGATGAVLHEVRGDGVEARFASTVRGVPDLSGDGVADFLVASYWGDSAENRVEAWSGADRSRLWSYERRRPSQMGWKLEPLPDMDGDDVADVLVVGHGHFRLLSGTNGSELYHKSGGGLGSFGFDAALLEDVNGDGLADFAISAPHGDGHHGQVLIYSGADGELLRSIVGAYFAGSCLAAGDVTGDGRQDLLVGGRLLPGTASELRLYDPATGEPHDLVIPSSQGYEPGCRVEVVPDQNGDGVLDVLSGGPPGERVRLLSLREAPVELGFFRLPLAGEPGVGIECATAATPDGLRLVVGWPVEDSGKGAVYLYGGGDPDPFVRVDGKHREPRSE